MQYDFLNKFENISKLEEVFDVIENIFRENFVNAYIPSLINEGKFIGEDGKDFYLKLVLMHQNNKINRTWLLNNLIFNLPDPDHMDEESPFLYNLIVYRNYKNKKIYQLHPLLTNDERYVEYGVANNKYVEAYFNSEYHERQGQPIFFVNNDDNYYILKELLSDYVNEPQSNVYPKYELVAEFEYRNTNKHIVSDISEIRNEKGFIDFNSNEKNIWVRGSIRIPLKEIKSENHRNIQVIDLGIGHIRIHNPSNYTGDKEDGFVVFKKEVIKILTQFYYLYDIELIEKENNGNRILVDYFEDKVVLWEGEYNKLPNEIKDKIDVFNYVPSDEDKELISPAMYTMQIEGSWNWDEKLLPDKKLAYEIKSMFFERAIDMQLSFLYPEQLIDLQNFIRKIERLTDIKLENFNLVKDVRSLIQIRDSELKEERLQRVDILELYMKYCHAVAKRLENVRK
ncbi:hypothetical protein CR203_18270 [Salipaludibacillus neizhouensis]|uniref:Uncharacterized protein n=2 Tax=Salipaludibacillus neizhouensis TaxID=885475 RepID=A0A3A9K3F5_9BACI|nr:hypothetical protein [Salipaludibacillus neizhouensis]RKL65808.1 hypothetical protein CR203_18270 [Salipaludibacillus neizhouensis]